MKTLPAKAIEVLILILLEVGLLEHLPKLIKSWTSCLNPYSTGSWVAGHIAVANMEAMQVLILILLEVGLLAFCKTY